MELRFETNRVVLDAPPKSTLKLTATRLGSVLGINEWQSDFSAWAEITKVYKKPFIETPQIIAGRIIEDILVDYCRELYGGIIGEVVNPKEYFGLRYDSIMRKKDFYPDDKVFGGMWDAKIVNSDGSTYAVIECKTTGRAKDWEDGVPLEKLVQGLFYANKENATKLIMPVAFLTDKDYEHPEKFIPIEGKNFKLFIFDVPTTAIVINGNVYNIEGAMSMARDWWTAYVEKGISPVFDTNRDKEILDYLKTKVVTEDDSLESIISALTLKKELLNFVRVTNNLDGLEKEIDDLTKKLKTIMISSIGDNDKITCNGYTLSKRYTSTIDKDKLKSDGIIDNYLKTSESFTLTYKEEK